MIIFTGLLSTAFLGRLLKGREWLGMATVIAGLAVVGAADFIYGGDGANSLNSIVTGDLLIVMGTSLFVQPFASLIDQVPKGCPRLLLNRQVNPKP